MNSKSESDGFMKHEKSEDRHERNRRRKWVSM